MSFQYEIKLPSAPEFPALIAVKMPIAAAFSTIRSRGKVDSNPVGPARDILITSHEAVMAMM